jgi:hypothetical protein
MASSHKTGHRDKLLRIRTDSLHIKSGKIFAQFSAESETVKGNAYKSEKRSLMKEVTQLSTGQQWKQTKIEKSTLKHSTIMNQVACLSEGSSFE